MGSLRGSQIDGHAIRALRIAQRKSQATLASQSDLDHRYVSRIECEQHCHLTPEITKRLADALGVPMAALLAEPQVLVEEFEQQASCAHVWPSELTEDAACLLDCGTTYGEWSE
jgi:transcriptional regulator with XRE-family HTH domain